MDATVLAQWQYAITTICHFFFVPLSIGLSIFIAILETRYVRTGDEKLKGTVKFLGKIFLINFAVGVATGIVQEFQFGMNWSEYSRYVGDIFGAPLAIEALLAFFIESTFLGLWIFGWQKLSKKVHLACIWLVAIGTTVSAFWILTANSFMQHPVGYTVNEAAGRAELTSFSELITNSHTLYQFTHVIACAITTVGFFVLGIAAYQIIKDRERAIFSKVFNQAMAFALVGVIAVILIGHFQSVYLVEEQPMKMAAADAHWNTSDDPDWAIVAIIDTENGETIGPKIPGLLSFLSYNDFSGRLVEGINDLQAEMAAEYGEDNYVPNVYMTFYAFRAMLGAGGLMLLFAFLAFLWRKPEKLVKHQRFLKLLLPCMVLPYIANTGGWLVAEMGRQPWIVYGLQKVSDGVSVSVSAASVLITLIGFTLVYAALIVLSIVLISKVTREGMVEEPAEQSAPVAAG